MDELAAARIAAENRVARFAEEHARLGLYDAARNTGERMQCDFEYESQGVKVVCPFSALPGGRRCPGHVPEIRNGQAQAVHEHQWEHRQPIGANGGRLAAGPSPYQMDPSVRLDAMSPRPRAFTREEVLAVLRAQKVLISATLGENEADIVLGSIITIFERTE